MGRGGSRRGAGRPTTSKRQTVSLAFDPLVLALLDAHALRAGISRSEAVNKLLSESLRQSPPDLSWGEISKLMGFVDAALGPELFEPE